MSRVGACVIALALLGLARPVAAEAVGAEPRSAWTWPRAVSVGVVGTTYATAWLLVSRAWWTQGGSGRFRFRSEGAFGVDTYAGGADKLGHLHANHVATRLFTGILAWGGFSRPVSIASAALLTTSFFTAVEVKDGYQPRYGFSVGDLVANLTGQAAALGLLLVPELDAAVSIRLMYFPSRDYLDATSSRVKLDIAEDYSGQTYLLCFHLAAVSAVKREVMLSALRFVDLSLGYAAVGYAPLPRTPAPARQLLSFGVSLNLQSAFDTLLAGSFRSHAAAASVLHFVNEVYQPPGTRAPLVTEERRRRRPAR